MSRRLKAYADESPTKGAITDDEKQRALKAAKATALMMPYLEQGRLVPGSVRSEIQALYTDATEEVLVVGMMRGCDVALKHLAKHFWGDSLTDAALEAGSMIDRMRPDDIAGLGARAYDDGVRAVQLMAEAMVSRGTLNPRWNQQPAARSALTLRRSCRQANIRSSSGSPRKQ